jgi:carboxylesterase type B
VYARERALQQREDLATRRQWQALAALHCKELPLVLERIRHGTESWTRRLWSTLTSQYCTHEVAVMTTAMNTVVWIKMWIEVKVRCSREFI